MLYRGTLVALGLAVLNACGGGNSTSGNTTNPILNFSPSSLTFTSQAVGTPSISQPIQVSNTGTAALTLTVGVSGDFSQSNNCGASVSAGASCTVSIVFTPTATGTRAGTLSLTDNVSGSPQAVSLSGTGMTVIASVLPASLVFASQGVGSPSAVQGVTFSSTGTGAVTLTSIAASGDFSETNNCGTSIGAGGSCNVSVTFTPTAPGTRNGTLTVTDNAGGAPGNTQTVALTGTATADTPMISLSTASLTFSTTINIPDTQNVTVSNTSAFPLSFSSIVASPSSNFSQTNLCGGGINGIGSCTISVTFNSATVGTFTGSLTITDNAGGSPQTVSLSGTASIPPTVSASPSSVNFGNQDVAVTSLPQTVTLNNTGTSALSVTSITLAGTEPGDFSQTNNCGASVNAGGSCAITVTFTPSTTGVRTATLTIADNATNSPQTVSLTGNGTGFTHTGNLQYPLMGQTATMLNNGLVLLAGGYNEVNGQFLFANSAQLYDTPAGTFSYTGSMITPRYAHTATLLDNGLVLIAGGEMNQSLTAIASSELYNPTTGAFTQTGNLNTPRVTSTATLLPNGMVLIAGGTSSQTAPSSCLASAELYDPSFGTYSYTGRMNTPRCTQTATLLDSGMVLIAGGDNGGNTAEALTSAELYDPSTGTFSYTSNNLPQNPSVLASPLNGGTVYFPCASSVFDPSGIFTPAAGLSCYESLDAFFFSQLLTNGTVLILGNYGPLHLGIAYVYDPVAGAVTEVGNSNAVRGGGTTTLLANGMVLVAGGESSPDTAELYQPDSLAPPNLLSIAITPGSITLSPGGTQQCIATGTFSDGSTERLASVTWSSSDSTVAEISNDVTNSGLSLAIASGTVTVTASAGSVSGSVTLTVRP